MPVLTGFVETLPPPAGPTSTAKQQSAVLPLSTRDGFRLEARVDRGASDRAGDAVVIMVHGFAGNREENGLFTRVAQALSQAGFHAVRYDCRGIGGSEGSYGDHSLETHAQDLADVVSWSRSELHVDRVYALGFSLGAAFVGIAQRDRLCEFAGVVYWAPAVRPALSMWPRYDTGENAALLELHGFIEKGPDKVPVGRRMFDSIRRTDLGPEAFNLPLPTLVCHGTEDSKIEIRHSDELARRSDCDYGRIEGATHSFRPHEEHLPTLTGMLLSWLETRESARLTGPTP